MEVHLNSDSIKNLINELINQRQKRQEMIIVPSAETGEQKLYIPVEEY